MNEVIHLALAALSGVAAVVTILYTDYGAIKGKYQADWAGFARSLLSFAALAAFFLATIVFSDTAILLRWSSYAYLVVAAITYLGAGIVLWAGSFNRFQLSAAYGRNQSWPVRSAGGRAEGV